MSNLDKLNKIFVNVFGVDEGILNSVSVRITFQNGTRCISLASLLKLKRRST